MLHGFAAAIKRMVKEGLILSVIWNSVCPSARILVHRPGGPVIVDAVLCKRRLDRR